MSRIDGYLAQRDPVEEIAAEFMERCRNGENPSIEDYAFRYPHLARDIRGLFPTIAALEQMKRDDRRSAARLATSKPLKLTPVGGL